jgi:hypothetical protein
MESEMIPEGFKYLLQKSHEGIGKVFDAVEGGRVFVPYAELMDIFQGLEEMPPGEFARKTFWTLQEGKSVSMIHLNDLKMLYHKAERAADKLGYKLEKK